jgi:outer membrane protein insertion porin family
MRTALEFEMRTACFLLLFLFVVTLLTAGPAMAQSTGQFKLADVTVVGSAHYQEPEIVRASGLKIGELVSVDTLKQAATRLGTSGVFAEVNYRYHTRGEALTVEFTVQDAGHFLPCTFENFVWMSRDELLAGLRSRVPLFYDQVPASGDQLERVSSALEEMLQDHGIQAKVAFSPTGAAGGPVEAIQYRVTGLPIPVLRIDFTGVQKVDPALLQAVARPLIGKEYDASYIAAFSNAGIGLVYRQRGYLQARFGRPVPQLLKEDGSPNSVAITIPVSEGELFTLKEITWSGQSAIPYEELARKIRQRPGTPVDALRLEQDALALPMLFHANGYLDADARMKPALDDSAHTAAYQIQINQGDLYRLGKLEIAGLDDGHMRSVEKMCRLDHGDPYEPGYWNALIQQALPSLPRNASGWKASARPTIHKDTKTVDVLLTFAPRASR